MSRFVTIILFCLVQTSTVLGQASIGLKLGIGLSTPHVAFSQSSSTDRSSPDGGRPGMTVGLITQIPLANKWWLKPAVQFAWKGFFERYESIEGYQYRLGNTMNYLEVPLTIVHTSGQKGTGFQLGGGPVLSYLLNPNFRGYALERRDIGLGLSTGYQEAIGFSINFSYTHGLTDLSKDKTSFSSLKNRFVAFTLGYLF